MIHPESFYTKNIEKHYGAIRNEIEDIELVVENSRHYNEYNIEERMDLTKLNIYSIDPENCQDVDDAFSYCVIDNSNYIIIHIADPTHYISKHSLLFKDIIERAFTRYPSNRTPIHMMPHDIVNWSSLHENEHGNIKKAISIFIKFDENNKVSYEDMELQFSIIKVKQEFKLAYSDDILKYDEIKKCLELSEYLFPDIFYNQDRTLEVKYNHDNEPYFYNSNENEIKAKKMIAKFAILSNNYVGYLLKSYFSINHVIFRNCNFENSQNMKTMTKFKDFIEFIISNGITASYDNKNSKHDLLKVDEYLHMTSPLRRSNDCIIHYLLKHSYLQYRDTPFTEYQIIQMIDHSNMINKKLKKIQFRDSKFRMLHCMQETKMKQGINSYNIEYYIYSFFYPYVNIVIHKLDNKDVYMSCTLKRPHIKEIKDSFMNKNHNCVIHQINCCNYYDEGCLPELDECVDSILGNL